MSNERQLVLYGATENDDRTILSLVEKKTRMTFEISLIRQNVTRDVLYT